MAIRVVVAEDNVLFREGLLQVLGSDADTQVVGVCGDRDTLLRLVRETSPDVVVTDIRMPPGHDDEGIQAAIELRRTHPGVGVVVLSLYASPQYTLSLLEEGAAGRGYLLKERVSDVRELISAVRTVAAGGSVVDPAVVDLLVRARSHSRSPLEFLTPREQEVLEAMAVGKSNAAIAQRLELSLRAVEKHSTTIFSKLGLTEEPDTNRRVRAVLVYLDSRLPN